MCPVGRLSHNSFVPHVTIRPSIHLYPHQWECRLVNAVEVPKGIGQALHLGGRNSFLFKLESYTSVGYRGKLRSR
jgi:hypothetical protein